jgi:hypothetical protein
MDALLPLTPELAPKPRKEVKGKLVTKNPGISIFLVEVMKVIVKFDPENLRPSYDMDADIDVARETFEDIFLDQLNSLYEDQLDEEPNTDITAYPEYRQLQGTLDELCALWKSNREKFLDFNLAKLLGVLGEVYGFRAVNTLGYNEDDRSHEGVDSEKGTQVETNFTPTPYAEIPNLETHEEEKEKMIKSMLKFGRRKGLTESTVRAIVNRTFKPKQTLGELTVVPLPRFGTPKKERTPKAVDELLWSHFKGTAQIVTSGAQLRHFFSCCKYARGSKFDEVYEMLTGGRFLITEDQMLVFDMELGHGS